MSLKQTYTYKSAHPITKYNYNFYNSSYNPVHVYSYSYSPVAI